MFTNKRTRSIPVPFQAVRRYLITQIPLHYSANILSFTENRIIRKARHSIKGVKKERLARLFSVTTIFLPLLSSFYNARGSPRAPSVNYC